MTDPSGMRANGRRACAGVVLVGTGRRPDADLTLDAIDALARCDIALCVGLDGALLSRARAFAPR
ncbi:MAG: hypothetical protein KGM24_01445, partial [Elusimicrobia bacterium]|nr:hypothetical protein [Elusimicrobiota bacterium]